MTQPEPLPLAAYATALAHLLRYRSHPTEKILASLQIPPDVFRQAEEYWTLQLAESHPQRKGIFAMKFATAFGQARLALALADARQVDAAASALGAPPGTSAELSGVAVPSFLRDDLAASATEIPPPPPISALTPAAPPAVPARAKVGASTAFLSDTAVPAEAPLPFRSDGQAPSGVFHAPTAVPASPGVGTGTALLDVGAARSRASTRRTTTAERQRRCSRVGLPTPSEPRPR